jgi:hypothetical protein
MSLFHLSKVSKAFSGEFHFFCLSFFSSPLTIVLNWGPSPASVSLLADHLQSALEKVTKGQVGGNWDMEELEIAAKEALQEGEGGYI